MDLLSMLHADLNAKETQKGETYAYVYQTHFAVW